MSTFTSADVRPTTQTHPLDSTAWTSLTGAHARFAIGAGRARRYRPEVSPFAALSSPGDEQAWADLGALYRPDEVVGLSGPPGFTRSRPQGWSVQGLVAGVQLAATPALEAYPDEEAVLLGPGDVAEALELTARTQPGPFLPQTYQLGTYLGIRRGGRLVAMAGERLHPPGWTEISAVCTDPEHRRQGLATRLVRAVAAGIYGRGETPFLHTGAANTRAIALYLELGFTLRREVEFAALHAPAAG